MSCRRGGGRAWGGDLIVFVGPGVGHLTDLVLPREGIFESFFARSGDIWLPTRTNKTETEHMFPASTLHACGVRFEKIRKSWRQWEQAKAEWISLFCFQFDQLNLLKYCGIKVNGSKEKPSPFLQVQLISVWPIRYNHCKLIKLTFFVPFTKNGIFKLTKCGLSLKVYVFYVV